MFILRDSLVDNKCKASITNVFFIRDFFSFVDSCTEYEYNHVRYKVMAGSDCMSFCQCSFKRLNADGSIEYYWQRHECPAGTLWSVALTTCNHAYMVDCGGE